jgi:pilus assembly protein CpaB
VLKAGDLVDILISLQASVQPQANTTGGAASAGNTGNSQQGSEMFTFDALQHLTIQAIVVDIRQNNQSGSSVSAGTPAPTPSRSEIQARAILLALAPQDALLLKHLKDAGGIVDIVLRAPTANQDFPVTPVSPEYLVDRYGLAIQPPGVGALPTPTP